VVEGEADLLGVKSFAASTSRTGMGTTSSFMSMNRHATEPGHPGIMPQPRYGETPARGLPRSTGSSILATTPGG
jgi:hypothetical protein